MDMELTHFPHYKCGISSSWDIKVMLIMSFQFSMGGFECGRSHNNLGQELELLGPAHRV